MTRSQRKAYIAEELGPCYDFCACWHCWRGWKNISFRTRLRWRIHHIRKHGWYGG